MTENPRSACWPDLPILGGQLRRHGSSAVQPSTQLDLRTVESVEIFSPGRGAMYTLAGGAVVGGIGILLLYLAVSSVMSGYTV